MNKAIISISEVLELVFSTVVWPAAAHHSQKAQRFIFDRTDTNGDGFFSKDEFLKSQLERFKKMDANRDCKVSFEENK